MGTLLLPETGFGMNDCGLHGFGRWVAIICIKRYNILYETCSK